MAFPASMSPVWISTRMATSCEPTRCSNCESNQPGNSYSFDFWTDVLRSRPDDEGRVYVGGSFTNINGLSRPRRCRPAFAVTAAVDEMFNTSYGVWTTWCSA